MPYPINFAANRALATEINALRRRSLIELAADVCRCRSGFVHGDGDPRPASAVRELAEPSRTQSSA